jgi:DNA-binding Lrp family transcriptional regulator
MAKNSNRQIEADEKRILNELSKNANKSVNEIAKTCKFSRQKVWRIIKNLEKNNTIWGYVAIIDDEKQDKKGYILLVKRNNKPLKDEVIEKIVKRDLSKRALEGGVEIKNSFYTNGIFDWLICFNAPDIKHAKAFVEDFNKLFYGFLSETYLLEQMFQAEKCGIVNPEIEKLRDFFSL